MCFTCINLHFSSIFGCFWKTCVCILVHRSLKRLSSSLSILNVFIFLESCASLQTIKLVLSYVHDAFALSCHEKHADGWNRSKANVRKRDKDIFACERVSCSLGCWYIDWTTPYAVETMQSISILIQCTISSSQSHSFHSGLLIFRLS